MDDKRAADAPEGDYHLLSSRGRYLKVNPDDFNGKNSLWIIDDVDSPLLDAGDPLDDFDAEPEPNGGRINIGAYGGTNQASRSNWPLPADFDRNGIVDLEDFASFSDQWLSSMPWFQY